MNKNNKCSDHPTLVSPRGIHLGSSPGSFFSTAVLLGALLSSPISSTAQYVACGGSVATQLVNPFTATATGDDAVVNAAALQHDLQGNTIKAIVYGRRDHSTPWGTGSADANLVVIDWNGNKVTVNIAGGVAPDVVLCDGPNTGLPGTPEYQAVVVYKICGDAFMDVYDITNAGTGSMTVTLTAAGATPLSTMGNSLWNAHNDPHIDAWADPAAAHPVTGLPMVREVAIVWSQSAGSAAGTPCLWLPLADRMHLSAGNVGTAYAIWSHRATPIGIGCMPDIACITEYSLSGGIGDQLLELTFYSVTTGELSYSEMNYTTGFPLVFPWSTVVSAPGIATPLDTGSFFSPRIEAMSYYDPAGSNAKWQIVTSKGGFPSTGPPTTGVVFQALGYNSLVPTPISLSGAYTNHDVKAPCVAAGVSPTFSTDLGNTQYTLGFFNRTASGTSDVLLSRSTDVTTGSLDGRWWDVPCAGVSYDWDAARTYALANCANSGLNLVAAWYDGTDVQFKETLNNMSFRSSPTSVSSSPGSHVSLAPNPAKDALIVRNAPVGATCSVLDITGRTLLTGTNVKTTTDQLDISGLPAGIYLLQIKNGSIMETFRFNKQ